MFLRELLLYLHLGGVLLLAAGVGASVACKVAAMRTSSAEAMLALLRTASGAVRRCAMPGSFLLLVAGIALVAGSHGAYSFDAPWILGAIALWVGSAVVGVKLHAPRSHAARALASELAERGEQVSEQLRAIVRGGRIASALDVAMLAGMVALMVFKPGY